MAVPVTPGKALTGPPVAYNSDLEMVKTLTAAHANANVANKYGVTPLIQASRTGDAAIVKALLDGGADVALAHPEGRVHFAGEHTSMWTGWMQGALDSARRVAREISP